MEKILELIELFKNGDIIFYGLVAGIIIFIILFFVLIHSSKKHKKYNKIIKEIIDIKDSIINQNTPSKLIRIERLGQNNASFNQLFINNKKDYEEIINLTNTYFDTNIEQTKKLYNSKNYKELKELLSNMNTTLSSYKDKLDIMNANLNLVIKDEDELISKRKHVESNLNYIKKELEGVHPGIEFLNNKFNKLFEDMDSHFEVLNEYMLRGNFNDAKECLDKLEIKISNIFDNLKNLFIYANEISNNIPSNLNNLINLYNDLKQQKYPLNHIPVIEYINECKNLWKSIANRLLEFNFENINTDIILIQSNINKINTLIGKEINSKKEFDQLFENIYNRAIDLDTTYIKSMKDDASLKRKFENNDKRNTLDREVKIENQKLNLIKSSLDSLNYSNQPYSIRLNKLYELKDQCDVFARYLGLSNESYKDLEKTSDDASKLLNEMSSKLRDLEIQLRNSKFTKLITKFEEDFKSAFNLVNRLNQILQKEPVDVDRVIQLSTELRKKVSEIEYSTSSSLQDALLAESLLLKGNSIRPLVASLDNDLTRCEMLFEDGRYSDCVDACKRALENYSDIEEL